jgi:hypothetical protein
MKHRSGPIDKIIQNGMVIDRDQPRVSVGARCTRPRAAASRPYQNIIGFRS